MDIMSYIQQMLVEEYDERMKLQKVTVDEYGNITAESILQLPAPVNFIDVEMKVLPRDVVIVGKK